MTIADDLRAADHKSDRPAVPSVFAEYAEFMATGKYPYIESVADFICSRHDIPDELAVNSNRRRDCGTKLSHEVYLASGQWHLREMVEQEKRLIAEGYTPITDIDPKAGQRIRLARNGIVYKMVPTERDTCLLPPRARTNGISLTGLQSRHQAFLRAKERGQTAMDGPEVVMYAVA